MKKYLRTLIQNDLFILLMNGMIAHVALKASIIAILQLPPKPFWTVV